MPVPSYYAGTGKPYNTGSTGSAYSGLGNVYQFGASNPAGPYAFMAQRPGGQRPSSQGQATGGAQSPASDAGTSVARQYLTGVVQGQNTPYNETTRNSMYSQASGMNASAEAAQNRQIQQQAAMSGASPNDPSYANLIRQSMAARQGANQQAMGDIDRTANMANQQAQMGAANRLLGSEDERFALQQGYNQRAAQTALGFLYGSGSGSGGGVNNFNLAQQQNSQNINQSAADRAQAQFQYEQELQRLQEDQAWNSRPRR